MYSSSRSVLDHAFFSKSNFICQHHQENPFQLILVSIRSGWVAKAINRSNNAWSRKAISMHLIFFRSTFLLGLLWWQSQKRLYMQSFPSGNSNRFMIWNICRFAALTFHRSLHIRRNVQDRYNVCPPCLSQPSYFLSTTLIVHVRKAFMASHKASWSLCPNIQNVHFVSLSRLSTNLVNPYLKVGFEYLPGIKYLQKPMCRYNFISSSAPPFRKMILTPAIHSPQHFSMIRILAVSPCEAMLWAIQRKSLQVTEHFLYTTIGWPSASAESDEINNGILEQLIRRCPASHK